MMGLMASSAGAQISVDFRPVAPGSDDLVLEWAADPTLSGPFDLLSRFVPAGEPIADALPLDPVSDLAVPDFPNGGTLSRSVESDGTPGTRIYQVVEPAGGCSNLAYLVTHGVPVREDAILSPALPWRGGLRSTYGLLEDNPQAHSVLVLTRQVPAGRPNWRESRRYVDGTLGPENYWVPPGAGVVFELSGPEHLQVVGAAEPAARPLAAGAAILPGGPPSSILSLPLAATQARALDLLCGIEGRDWQDPSGEGCPDSCLSGLHAEAADFTTLNQVGLLGLIEGRSLVPTPDGLQCLGTLTGRVDSTFAVWEGAADDGRAARLWAPEDAGATAGCRCLDSDGDGDDDCSERLRGTDPDDPTSFGGDEDGDGVGDWGDNCPLVANASQGDLDGDGFGDACDSCPDGDAGCEDADGDGVSYLVDNCRDQANPGQADGDADGHGDACDVCPETPDPGQVDADADGVGDTCDNCVLVFNPDQANRDGDPFADACDGCPDIYNSSDIDRDGDGLPDACDCASSDAGTWDLPRPIELLAVTKGPGGSLDLAWTDHRAEIGSATTWDLATGGLDELWTTGLAASASCRLVAHPAPSLSESTPDSRWFVVREANACGLGPWGELERLSELDFDEPCR
jgi:hypothetical protein